MRPARATHLVVGSDGLVGRALVARLRAGGREVMGTTRRAESANPSNLHLDLAGDLASWSCPEGVAVAFLCAGVTKIDQCRSDPGGSERVNVRGIVAIAEKLAAAGAFVIHLSTNRVFDGSVPHQLPDAPPSPTTEYGRQKSRAERRILALGANACVVRFTKVVAPGMPPFEQWIEDLRNGRPVHPFSDMLITPVTLSFALDVLERVADERCAGIVQVSADREVSYEEVARHIAHRIGVDASLVHPALSGKEGHRLDRMPLHTTLDTARLRADFGLCPPDPLAAVDSILGLP